MKSKYKVVIFDMDGTILDTLEDLADSVNYALEKHNYPVHSIDSIRSFVGNGIKKLIERATPEGITKEQIEEVLVDFRAYYQIHCADKTKPYDGIKEVIREIRNQGIYTAVVSNKIDSGVKALCKEYFDGLFDYTVGEREGIRRKPSPDSVLAVLEKFEADNTQALFIGDSDVDFDTAFNAKVDSLMVGWGFRTEEFLKEKGAKKVIKEPKEILALI